MTQDLAGGVNATGIDHPDRRRFSRYLLLSADAHTVLRRPAKAR